MKIKIYFAIIWICSICHGQVKYDFFTKEILLQDLAYFSEKLTSIHPVFMDKTYKNKWGKEFEIASKQLKDSMTQNEFYLLVSPLLAYLNDSHSNFECPSDQRKQFMMSGLSFPFSVTLKDNSIRIKEYYGDDSCLFQGGEEIIKINDIASSVIISHMQKLIGGNSDAIRNKTIETYFRSYLWMICNFENDYQLWIKDKLNRLSKIHIKGITNAQFLKNRKRYSSITQQRYCLEIDSINKTSIFTIHSFADLKSFCAFADSAFQIITDRNIHNLIIDIRGNGGGRSIVVDSLMNFLTDKPYAQYKTIEIKISKDLRDYYKEEYPGKFQMIKDYPVNELATLSGEKVIPHNKKSRFKGRLFLLTDEETYSGAATFAGLFKELKLGIIIGEETGGTIGYYGDFWYITLPNSKLRFYISPKRFIQYGGTDLNRGVEPDYTIKNKGDSIINFTYKLIEKHGNAAHRQ